MLDHNGEIVWQTDLDFDEQSTSTGAPDVHLADDCSTLTAYTAEKLFVFGPDPG
jgi:hypothetical protein